MVGDHPGDGGWPSMTTSPGLDYVSKVSVQNCKSVVHFLLVDFSEVYLLLLNLLLVMVGSKVNS